MADTAMMRPAAPSPSEASVSPLAEVKPAQLPPRFSGKTISVSRAAKMLQCSCERVRNYLAQGELQGYQLVRHGWWKVYYDSVVALLADGRSSADA